MRLVEVSIGAHDYPEIGEQVNLQLAVIAEALSFGLAHDRIDAPVRKIAAKLVKPTPQGKPLAFAALNVANVFVPLEPVGALGDSIAEARHAAGALVLDVLDVVATSVPWDDTDLRALVREIAGHVGSYRYAGRRPVSNHARKLRYQTAYEFDEARAGVRLDCFDRSGTLVASRTVAEIEPFYPFWRFFQATRLELGANEYRYLAADGSVVASGPVPA